MKTNTITSPSSTLFSNRFSWKRFWHFFRWDCKDMIPQSIMVLAAFSLTCLLFFSLAKHEIVLNLTFFDTGDYGTILFTILIPLIIFLPLSQPIVNTGAIEISNKNNPPVLSKNNSLIPPPHELTQYTNERYLSSSFILLFNAITKGILWFYLFSLFFTPRVLGVNLHYFRWLPLFVIAYPCFIFFVKCICLSSLKAKWNSFLFGIISYSVLIGPFFCRLTTNYQSFTFLTTSKTPITNLSMYSEIALVVFLLSLIGSLIPAYYYWKRIQG